MIGEQWEPLRGHEGLYEISNFGRVKRLLRTIICKNGMPKPFREKILIPHQNSTGYLFHQFPSKPKKDFRFVHRMVAEAFVDNPDNKPFVNHKSGIKTENVAANLEWVTRKENVSHAFGTGLMSHAGEKNSQSRLTAERVAIIRSECKPGTRATRALAAKYQISQRRLYDVINDPDCWKAVA